MLEAAFIFIAGGADPKKDRSTVVTPTVRLTAIGVYSMNTKDEEVIAAQKKVREIVFAHPYVRQMHGFYLVKEPKTMRFDLVISFDAKDRRAAFAEAVADVQKAFPDYALQTAMDTDFAEE